MKKITSKIINLLILNTPLFLLLSSVVKTNSQLSIGLTFAIQGIILSLIWYQQKFGKIKQFLYIITLLVIFITLKIPILIILIPITTYYLTEFILQKKLLSLKLLEILVLISILFSYLLISYSQNQELLKNITKEPGYKQIQWDPQIYQKIYYRYNRYKDYYKDVFIQVFVSDSRVNYLPYDIWSFRTPAIFTIWKLISFGNILNVYYLFNCLAILILLFSYLISKKFINNSYSLITPFLLLPYLIYPSITGDMEFLQTEWWSLLPIFIYLYLIFTKNYKLSYAFFAFALIIRPLNMIHWFGIFLISLIFKKYKTTKSLLINLIIFEIYFIQHSFKVFNSIPLSFDALISGRGHAFGFEMIRQTLVFSTWNYLFAQYKLFSIYLLIAIVLLLINFIFIKKKLFSLSIVSMLFILPLLRSRYILEN